MLVNFHIKIPDISFLSFSDHCRRYVTKNSQYIPLRILIFKSRISNDTKSDFVEKISDASRILMFCIHRGKILNGGFIYDKSRKN